MLKIQPFQKTLPNGTTKSAAARSPTKRTQIHPIQKNTKGNNKNTCRHYDYSAKEATYSLHFPNGKGVFSLQMLREFKKDPNSDEFGEKAQCCVRKFHRCIPKKKIKKSPDWEKAETAKMFCEKHSPIKTVDGVQQPKTNCRTDENPPQEVACREWETWIPGVDDGRTPAEVSAAGEGDTVGVAQWRVKSVFAEQVYGPDTEFANWFMDTSNKYCCKAFYTADQHEIQNYRLKLSSDPTLKLEQMNGVIVHEMDAMGGWPPNHGQAYHDSFP